MGLEPTQKLFLREPRLPIPPHLSSKLKKFDQVPTGFEPATLGLTDPRSTTELRNKKREKRDLNPHHVGRQPSTLPLSYSP